MITSLVVLFFSIIVHEVAHGYASYRLGDPTARDANRITLNPLAHIDLFGTILLPMILIATKSPVLLGWAKPVPFNPAYFRDVKKGIMIVGAAGPAANLGLALLASALLYIGGPLSWFEPLLVLACVINVGLALFNLIPIPPLDGSRIVVGFLPWRLIPGYLRVERFGFVIIFALLWLGALDRVINPLIRFVLRLLLPLAT